MLWGYISKRLSKIIDGGFCKIIAIADFEKCGYDYLLPVGIRVQGDKLEEVAEILSNQKEILLPEFITSVPTIQLLNRGNKCLTGSQIIDYIDSKKPKQIDEPLSFNFGDINNSGVFSDCFSFLDQSIESMSAKGNGGLRQLRNNATLEYVDSIETPVDDYTPNKVGDVSLDKLQQ